MPDRKPLVKTEAEASRHESSRSRQSSTGQRRTRRSHWGEAIQQTWLHLLASVAFYTVLPIPWQGSLDFRGIARLAPLVGLGLGLGLGLLDWVLELAGAPVLTRSAIAVAAWLALTGGLHLDGAIDTADGLGVRDPQRRLSVMAESTTGAFGAMVAAMILLLKIAALADISMARGLALAAAATWARWAQVVAILAYPYLRADGKGRFHKDTIRSPWELVPGWLLAVSISGCYGVLYPNHWLAAVGWALGGGAIACLVGAWFNRQLGGQTGDTYGAIVEWTEALLLCTIAIF
ncbi:MAG: adenosylcobinamide-GDP ribazoletransferase [Oscillatoriales cyanobacterium]|nr:MAG: adenosylcobinamide-GDP ribazoletransferase [Oscillatoriales cyanobacterium]